MTWELRDQNTNQALSCAAGEQVRVTAGGITDIFPCAPLAGTTGGIPPGTYNVLVELTDSAGRTESSTTIPASVFNRAVTDLGHVIFLVRSATGNASFSWELRIQSTGQLGSCAPAGETVQIDFGGSNQFTFPCDPKAAVIQNIPANTYSVAARLYLGSTLESQTNNPITVTVPAGGTAPDQHIVFLVTS